MAQIEDPTLTAIKDYDLSGAEATCESCDFDFDNHH